MFAWSAYDLYKAYKNPNRTKTEIAMAWAGIIPGGKQLKTTRLVTKSVNRFIKGRKTAHNIEVINIGSKFVKVSYEIQAKKAAEPARAVYIKYISKKSGKTLKVVKDTYDRNNRMIHRKIKYQIGK